MSEAEIQAKIVKLITITFAIAIIITFMVRLNRVPRYTRRACSSGRTVILSTALRTCASASWWHAARHVVGFLATSVLGYEGGCRHQHELLHFLELTEVLLFLAEILRGMNASKLDHAYIA